MGEPQIRMTPGGGMEAIGHCESWEDVPRDAQAEIERLRAAFAETEAQLCVPRTLGDIIRDARSLADWYDLQHNDIAMTKYLRDVADNLASEPSKVIRTPVCNSPKEGSE